MACNILMVLSSLEEKIQSKQNTEWAAKKIQNFRKIWQTRNRGLKRAFIAWGGSFVINPPSKFSYVQHFFLDSSRDKIPIRGVPRPKIPRTGKAKNVYLR